MIALGQASGPMRPAPVLAWMPVAAQYSRTVATSRSPCGSTSRRVLGIGDAPAQDLGMLASMSASCSARNGPALAAGM